MNDLEERLRKMPTQKVIKVIEIFVDEYSKLSKKDTPFSLAKYFEKEWISFLRLRKSNKKMEKEIRSMVPRTSYSVFLIFLKIGSELAEATKFQVIKDE